MSLATDFAPGAKPKRSEWSAQACRLLVLCGVTAFWVAAALGVALLAWR